MEVGICKSALNVYTFSLAFYFIAALMSQSATLRGRAVAVERSVCLVYSSVLAGKAVCKYDIFCSNVHVKNKLICVCACAQTGCVYERRRDWGTT